MYMKLMKFWLPNIKFLRSHLEDMSKQHVPLIVVGMKEDLRKGVGCEYGDSEARFGLLALDFPNLIETYMEVSIRQNPAEAREVLHHSLKGVMHPIGPLFDCEEKCLSFRLIRALSRIFNVYDTDKDGFLSEEDLKVMHQASYGEQLDAFGIEEIKDLFTYIFPQGFDHRGLSLEGFFHLHSMYAKRGCYEHTWALLASAGYNMEVKFREDIVPLMTSKAEGVELSSAALKYLERRYRQTLCSRQKVLSHEDLDILFKDAKESPWDGKGYLSHVERTATGGLAINGYMSMWIAMTIFDPAKTVASLIDLCYLGDPGTVLRITRKQHPGRNVFQCFLFGPKKAGKSALMDSFIKRPFCENHIPTAAERFAVNNVDRNGEPKKTLLLREIPEGGLDNFFSDQQSLASCDVAIFVYDSSDARSWQGAKEMLIQVSRHGEKAGFEVPCLIVAAKSDLNMAGIEDSKRVADEMGIAAPILVTAKNAELNNLFVKMLEAAERLHDNIPQYEAVCSESTTMGTRLGEEGGNSTERINLRSRKRRLTRTGGGSRSMRKN